MKVAILYICTGIYNRFWPGFFESAERFLLPEDEKHYFVFTDDMKLANHPRVHLQYKQCEGFPKDSLFRFDMFLRVKEQLKGFDYIFFLNANAQFLQPVGRDEFLPRKGEKLVAAYWPRRAEQNPHLYPYERRKTSKAYIAPNKPPYHYYMGGINGGETKAYLEMIETLAANIADDYSRGIIATMHDESHINAYLRNHPCKVLSWEYCIPEEWVEDKKPKMVFREKTCIDPYFNKGRDHSLKGKVKKAAKLLWHIVSWYL